jgi:hypothetical protein
MKKLKLIAIALACVACTGAFAQRQSNPYGNPYGSANSNPYGSAPGSGYTNPNSHAVDGYVRGNGTYVAPSHATNANSTRSDNYGTKGNVNPYTGKAGTRY